MHNHQATKEGGSPWTCSCRSIRKAMHWRNMWAISSQENGILTKWTLQSIDLTERARTGKLDPTIGRDEGMSSFIFKQEWGCIKWCLEIRRTIQSMSSYWFGFEDVNLQTMSQFYLEGQSQIRWFVFLQESLSFYFDAIWRKTAHWTSGCRKDSHLGGAGQQDRRKGSSWGNTFSSNGLR